MTMEGKTVIVTGGNKGIGFETALELAKKKARVILTCRNTELGENAAENIRKSIGNPNVAVRHLDLSSFDSVRKFASEIIATENRLDVLIHNAGIIPPRGRHITKDNLELTFQTNHFGPFLLNHLLLDLLKQSAPSRIIVVSSAGHVFGTLDFNNLNCEKHERNPVWIYNSTKLANILFTRELSRKLKGTGVTVNALHPGIVRTSLWRSARENSGCLMYLLYPFMKTSKSAAKTYIHLASSNEVANDNGKYFIGYHKFWTFFAARNDRLASKLWNISETITGIKSDQDA